MCDSISQCSAFGLDNQRCLNETYKSTRHCSEHFSTATKLYLNYKKICNVAYSLNIHKEIPDTNEKIDYLNKCYVWLNKAYEARMAHRKYAFVPECYDDGHNKQFEIINNKMDICEKKLFAIYNYYEQKNKNMFDENENEKKNETETETETQLDSDSEIDADSDSTGEAQIETETGVNTDLEKQKKTNNKLIVSTRINNSIKHIPHNINRCKAQRKQSDDNINALLDKYIKKNRVLLQWQDQLIELILSTIKKLVEPKIILNSENKYYTFVSVFKLVYELNKLGYFADDFEPEICKNCSCNNYVYNNIVLSCQCSYFYRNIKQFIRKHSQIFLKQLYETLLRHFDRIKPVVYDMIFFLKIYEERILTRKLTITWDKEVNRFIMLDGSANNVEKNSKTLASYRLKDKQYFKKYEEDELYYDFLDDIHDFEQEKGLK